MLKSVGFITLDPETGDPYRAQLGRPGSYRSRKAPPKVYPTAKRAAAYGPGEVKEVFIVSPEEPQT